MTYETKTDPLSPAQVSITSIGGADCSNHHQVAAKISRYGAGASAGVGNGKTLSL